jgi:hypothetical protein
VVRFRLQATFAAGILTGILRNRTEENYLISNSYRPSSIPARAPEFLRIAALSFSKAIATGTSEIYPRHFAQTVNRLLT